MVFYTRGYRELPGVTCRIIVADDHPLFREALARTVKRVVAGACIEEAGNLDEVMALADCGEVPDTLILDLRFPGLVDIQCLARLRQQFRRTTLIIVSMVDDPAIVEQVMATGVEGFIGKSIAADEIGRQSSPYAMARCWSGMRPQACCPTSVANVLWSNLPTVSKKYSG